MLLIEKILFLSIRNENVPTRLRQWTTETVALRVTNALWSYLKAERVRIVPSVWNGQRSRFRIRLLDRLLRYQLGWCVPSSLVFLREKNSIICETKLYVTRILLYYDSGCFTLIITQISISIGIKLISSPHIDHNS